MAVEAVGQFGVDFVRQYDNVCLPQDGGDLLQSRRRSSQPPVGLLGYGKISSLVLGVMAARSWSAVRRNSILGAGGNVHRNAAGQLGRSARSRRSRAPG